MKNYFLYYTFTDSKGNHGEGNIDVSRSHKIRGIDDVRSMEEALKDEDNHKSVVIHSWQAFEE